MNPVGKSALFAAAAFAAAAASPARAAIPGLKWSLDAGVSLSGSMLTAILDDPSGTAYARATIDISDCLGEDTGAAFSFRMRGFDIAGRAAANNGVKAMIVSTTASGTTVYPQVTLPDGSFDWTNGVVRVNFLRGNLPANGTVMIAIGLEKCTGRAEFDLSALSLVVESLGIERVNEDYIVRYPSCSEGVCEAPHSRTLNKSHENTKQRQPARGVKFACPEKLPQLFERVKRRRNDDSRINDKREYLPKSHPENDANGDLYRLFCCFLHINSLN